MRIAIIALVVAAFALALGRPIAANITGTATTGNATVQIGPLSGSDQTGTATLTSTIDDKTQVVIELSGEPPGANEPAHIHTGTCKKLNPKPAYLLENVAGGTSTSTVNASLASLETGHFSVNVHESTANIGTYVACGTIPAVAQPRSVPSTTPQPVSTYEPQR